MLAAFHVLSAAFVSPAARLAAPARAALARGTNVKAYASPFTFDGSSSTNMYGSGMYGGYGSMGYSPYNGRYGYGNMGGMMGNGRYGMYGNMYGNMYGGYNNQYGGRYNMPSYGQNYNSPNGGYERMTARMGLAGTLAGDRLQFSQNMNSPRDSPYSNMYNVGMGGMGGMGGYGMGMYGGGYGRGMYGGMGGGYGMGMYGGYGGGMRYGGYNQRMGQYGPRYGFGGGMSQY